MLTMIDPYVHARPTLRTGDLILFEGVGLAGKVISWWTGSPITHVGIIYRVESEDLVFCLESTMLSKHLDIQTGRKNVKGVQLTQLSSRAAAYKGPVWYRSINKSLSPKMRQALLEFRKEVKGKPYEKNWKEFLRASLGASIGENTEDGIFCSELLAAALQYIQVLRQLKFANAYLPSDFDYGKALITEEFYAWGRKLPLNFAALKKFNSMPRSNMY